MNESFARNEAFHTSRTSGPRRLASVLAALASALSVACSGGGTDDFADDSRLGEGPNGSATGSESTALACRPGKDYASFGGTKVGDTDRAEGEAGVDRARVKPLSALRTEYARVLGVVPASLAAQEASIGKAQARWFVEPEAGAVALFSLYKVAFDGCSATMKGGATSLDPTAATAKSECSAMGRRFWSRSLTDEEADTCAKLAVSGLEASTSASERWSHACASVLTSAGFLSY